MPLADSTGGTPPSTTGTRKGGTGRPGPDAPSASGSPKTGSALQDYTRKEEVRLPALPDMPEPVPMTYMPGAMGTMVLVPSPVIQQTTAPEAEKVGEEPEREQDKAKGRKSYEMTWDDYEALSDQQRAAVDFNTMLVEARQKDLKLQDKYEASPSQRSTYNQAVERMFGDDGGSQLYAPETVAVLNQIGFEATDARRGDDLDDFLGLKAAITEKNIEDFALPSKQSPAKQVLTGYENAIDSLPFVNVTGDSRADLTAQLTAKTATLEDKLAQGNKLLQNFQASTRFARNEELQYFGGRPNDVKVPLGFGESADDQYFRTAFETIANKAYDQDMDQVIGLITQDLGPKGQMDAFWKYVDLRTKQAMEHGTPLVEAKNVQARTPEEYREMFDLDKAGE